MRHTDYLSLPDTAELRAEGLLHLEWPEEISEAARQLAHAVSYRGYSDGEYAAEVLAETLLRLRRMIRMAGGA